MNEPSVPFYPVHSVRFCPESAPFKVPHSRFISTQLRTDQTLSASGVICLSTKVLEYALRSMARVVTHILYYATLHMLCSIEHGHGHEHSHRSAGYMMQYARISISKALLRDICWWHSWLGCIYIIDICISV